MILTIGMPSYKNPTEVWATITALKMYHDLADTEILIVDNAGSSEVKHLAKSVGVRCETYTEKVGANPAKNAVFNLAQGDFVLCIDSHVMLWPESVKKLKDWVRENYEEARNLIHGPMVYDSQKKFSVEWKDKWRGHMWGTWDAAVSGLPTETREVRMAACGLIGCRRDSWLGFHPDCRGFGGEAGVIHEKYRRAKRKALILPWLIWAHNFHRGNAPYPLQLKDVVANYLLGFEEIGLDNGSIYEHFGEKLVTEVQNGLSK